MAYPNFSQFRQGTRLLLPGELNLAYTELRDLGLQDYYIRVIHDLGVQEKLTKPQVKSWLQRLRSRDRAAEREVRAELEALRSGPVPQVQAAPRPGSSRTRPERVVRLTSRADHKRAVTDAKAQGLTPVPIPPHTLRPGQSPEAHSVQAPERIASKLITTGNWKTSE